MKFNKFKVDDWLTFCRSFVDYNKLSYTGSGAYSTVYSSRNKTDKTVYKISTLSPAFVDGYLVYLKHVLPRLRNNPHAPIVYGVNIYEFEFDGEIRYGAITRMEKLLEFHEVETHIRERILFSEYGIDANPCRFLDDDEWMGEISRDIRHKTFNILGEIHSQTFIDLLIKVEAARKSMPKRKYASLALDFHDGNFMWRKRRDKYELVLADPLA